MSEVSVVPSLTSQEDTFALAVIEYGGNLGAAYRATYGDVQNPVARARELVTRPEIALRIKQLGESIQEQALISLGSHLVKLAEIRDLAAVAGQYKVALQAETQRGTVVGFYTDKTPNKGSGAKDSGNSRPVQIFIGQSPANINDWAGKQGRAPVIVENGS